MGVTPPDGEVEARQTGGFRTDLQAGAVGLPGILMQGVATIAPSFAILASFVFTVSLAGIVTPLAYLLAGLVLLLMAITASQLAKELPSAGGWYTWIARALSPQAGFFAGWVFSIWLPPVAVMASGFLAKTVLEPEIKSQYSVTIPWWLWVVAIVGFVTFLTYRGIVISERMLLITGALEIIIMVALAIWGLADPGPGGFSTEPLNPSHFGDAPDLFLAVVFSIFAFSGWEATAPLAEESKSPRRYIVLGMIGSVLILAVYFVFVTWGYLVGIGVDRVGTIPEASAFPVFTLATRVWGDAWVILLFALLNSVIAVAIACFNGGTRTWYGMGRSGVLPKALAEVSPTRKTPDKAIAAEAGVCAFAFLLMLIFSVEDVFFTWALTITLGLILMYILANAGVIRYYLTVKRAEFNPLLHIVLPIVASVAVGYVGYKSVVPLPDAPARYAPIVLIGWLAVGAALLVWQNARGNREWLAKAQLAMDEAQVREIADAAGRRGARPLTPTRPRA
jgi:amino acid transporter